VGKKNAAINAMGKNIAIMNVIPMKAHVTEPDVADDELIRFS
jgi:hypothetical protein